MPSRPSTRSFQRDSFELTPPGKRQPTPIIAIRSFCIVVTGPPRRTSTQPECLSRLGYPISGRKCDVNRRQHIHQPPHLSVCDFADTFIFHFFCAPAAACLSVRRIIFLTFLNPVLCDGS